jgi:hypothetical protein
MYCYDVKYVDGKGEIHGIIEDSPCSGQGVLVWASEFKTTPERRKRIVNAIVEELARQGKKATVRWDVDR